MGGREGAEEAENLASSPHASLNRAHVPGGEESSILRETHENEGDVRRWRERRSRLVEWKVAAGEPAGIIRGRGREKEGKRGA